MNKLTREEALRIITSKSVITTEGLFRVKVTNVTPYSRELTNGARQVAIANFNAKTDYHEQAAATLFGQGDFDDAANQGLSRSILEGQFTPAKGQIVDITVERITTSNGVTGLFVTGCAPAPVEQPVKRSMEDFLSMAEGRAAEGVSALKEEEAEHAVPFGATAKA